MLTPGELIMVRVPGIACAWQWQTLFEIAQWGRWTMVPKETAESESARDVWRDRHDRLGIAGMIDSFPCGPAVLRWKWFKIVIRQFFPIDDSVIVRLIEASSSVTLHSSARSQSRANTDDLPGPSSLSLTSKSLNSTGITYRTVQ